MAAAGRVGGIGRIRKEVEDPNNTWDMQLMAALLKGDVTEAGNLLQKGAKIDHTAADAQGRQVTPFLAVAQKGVDVDTLAWIAGPGQGNPNPQYNGDQGTIFHHLVKADQLEQLEKLCANRKKISSSFSLDEVDALGQTATQLAINSYKPEAAKILIRHGARHPFQSLVDATHCQTARACCTGQTQLLETLLQCGDNPFQRDCNGQTLMHLAVQHPSIIDILLDRGVSINVTNWQGQTPLLYVIQNLPKAVDVVEALVARGADVNIGDSFNVTPLMHAILAYNTVMIKKLLECKADINTRDSFGGSALHWAVVARQKGALELLLSLEADVNAVDRGGETPLHRACTKGCMTAVQLLLTREGVDINIADHNGRVPLHAAVQAQQLAIVQALLKRCSDENPFGAPVVEKGKKPPPPKKGAANPAEQAISTKLNIEAQDNEGRTALQAAVALNNTELVKMLVATGANVRRPSKHGTLLHEAVYEGNETIVETLLNAKAIVDARDDQDHSPLHLAAQRGLQNIARLLIKAGATVDLQDSYHLKTALHIAAERRDAAMVEVLLKEGHANTSLTDEYIRTPLHCGCLKGDMPIIQLLLDAGAQPFRAVDIDGWTPLHCVCSVNCHQAIPLLTTRETIDRMGEIEVTSSENYYGDLIAKDHKGWLPLHVAVASGATECVSAVIALLQDLTTLNQDTRIPLTSASEVGPHHIQYSVHDLVAKKKPGESIKAALSGAAAAATPYSRQEKVNELLTALNLADNQDRTPFMLAAEFGYPKIAKLLIRAKLQEANPLAAVY
jgi:ankyrin repeat protein